MNRKMGNRCSMIQPLYVSTLHARNSQTNGLGMRDVSCPFTRVCIIFVLTYAYSLMHLFMEDSEESTGQMRDATTKSRQFRTTQLSPREKTQFTYATFAV